jgi:hypothetical protein
MSRLYVNSPISSPSHWKEPSYNIELLEDILEQKEDDIESPFPSFSDSDSNADFQLESTSEFGLKSYLEVVQEPEQTKLDMEPIMEEVVQEPDQTKLDMEPIMEEVVQEPEQTSDIISSIPIQSTLLESSNPSDSFFQRFCKWFIRK